MKTAVAVLLICAFAGIVVAALMSLLPDATALICGGAAFLFVLLAASYEAKVDRR